MKKTGNGEIIRPGPFKYPFVAREKRAIVFSLVVIGLCLALQVVSTRAESAPATDGQELSQSEKQKARVSNGQWLPIPVFITEPAIGYGLGMSLGYIHPQADADQREEQPAVQSQQPVAKAGDGPKPPPDITGVAGGYTDKDTWFAAVGHSGSWRRDTIRYVGALAYADVKSTYYILDRPFDFSLQGFAVYQDLKFRLGDSPFFLGGKLRYLQSESQVERIFGIPTDIPFGNITSRDVGAAVEASIDTRDNTFTPNSGVLLKLTGWRHDEAIGSDYDYWNGSFAVLSFHQLRERFVLGLRLEGSVVDGRPPFYAFPYITLRGIPALRYQGQQVGMAELEGRWNILPRWALLAFAGTGATSSTYSTLKNQDNIFSGGVGGRYLFMPAENLWLGVDIARGPEDTYLYITVGQAW